MKIEDIVALAKAGFNSEQITKLISAEKPATVTTPPPANENPATPPVKEQPAPAPQNDNGNMDSVTAKLDSILTLMRGSNILNSQQPKPETMDDIIASIINPKDEGGKE